MKRQLAGCARLVACCSLLLQTAGASSRNLSPTVDGIGLGASEVSVNKAQRLEGKRLPHLVGHNYVWYYPSNGPIDTDNGPEVIYSSRHRVTRVVGELLQINGRALKYGDSESSLQQVLGSPDRVRLETLNDQGSPLQTAYLVWTYPSLHLEVLLAGSTPLEKTKRIISFALHVATGENP